MLLKKQKLDGVLWPFFKTSNKDFFITKRLQNDDFLKMQLNTTNKRKIMPGFVEDTDVTLQVVAEASSDQIVRLFFSSQAVQSQSLHRQRLYRESGAKTATHVRHTPQNQA